MPKWCGWPFCLPAPSCQGFLSKNGLFPVMLSGMPKACLTPFWKRPMARPACPTENIIRGRTGCDAQVDGIEGANPICSFHLLTRSMSAITAVEAGWIGGNPDQQHGWRIFNTSGIPFKPRPVLGLSQFPHFADELVFAGFVLNRHHPDVINAPGFRRGSGSGGH